MANQKSNNYVGHLEHNIMRELNVNEIKEVSGGWKWIIQALDWAGRASTAADIAMSWQRFSEDAKKMSGGSAEQHPIATAAG
ncbi:MAG: hypothetical protein ACI936_001621, partial [Paraglaciecola sp.]